MNLDDIPKDTLDEILQKKETKNFIFNLNEEIMKIQYESFHFNRTQYDFEKFQKEITQYSKDEFEKYLKKEFEKNY